MGYRENDWTDGGGVGAGGSSLDWELQKGLNKEPPGCQKLPSQEKTWGRVCAAVRIADTSSVRRAHTWRV